MVCDDGNVDDDDDGNKLDHEELLVTKTGIKQKK